MLIKFRQRVMRWLRAADFAPGGDHYPEDCNTVSEPWAEPKKYSNRNNTLSGGIASMAKQLVKAHDESAELQQSRSKLQITVFPGLGGIAIQVHQYDAHTDDRMSTLHVIPEDKELSEELAKIITLQSMRS